MTSYQPRTDDMAFILSQVLRTPQQLQALPPFVEVDADLMRQILDEAGKFVGEVVAPLSRDGDEPDCRRDTAAAFSEVHAPCAWLVLNRQLCKFEA